MFCTKCGTQVADDAKFCPNCGQSTIDDAAPATATPAAYVNTVAKLPKIQYFFKKAPAKINIFSV